MSEEPRFSVDVEPPSEARWDKLEQRLMAARARDVVDAVPVRAGITRRTVGLWTVAGALAAAVTTLLVVPPRRELIHGTPIDPPAPIAIEGAARVTVGDATIITTDGARASVAQEFGSIRVTLAQGDVTCEVAPRGDRPPFFVLAGDVTVRVVGTKFAVHRPTSGPITVDVDHGTVEVTRAGHLASVTQGQTWNDGTIGATALPSSALASAPASGSSPSPTTQPTDGKARLEHAESLERTHPAAARAIYERLVDDPTRGVAARARYSLAFLDFEAKRYDSAARHAARYQRDFPRGKNAEDVLRLEILSYYHLDDPRRREAARRYLDVYPTGAFAEKARQIANWQ